MHVVLLFPSAWRKSLKEVANKVTKVDGYLQTEFENKSPGQVIVIVIREELVMREFLQILNAKVIIFQECLSCCVTWEWMHKEFSWIPDILQAIALTTMLRKIEWKDYVN